MSKVVKICLACFGVNMLFIVALAITQKSEESFISIGLFWLAALAIEFLAGLAFVFRESYRDWGKGILLGALLGLVVGFSVCSTAMH